MKQVQIILIVIGVLIIAVLAGREISGDKQAVKSDIESIHVPISHGVVSGYTTIIIDSCEYIEGFNRLAHKGNCKFCSERHRNESKSVNELVKRNTE